MRIVLCSWIGAAAVSVAGLFGTPESAKGGVGVDVGPGGVRVDVGPAGVDVDFGRRYHRADDQWRYKRHNGEWWYWTPGEYWLYHRGGDWHRYHPETFRRPQAVGPPVRHQPGWYFPGQPYHALRPGYGPYRHFDDGRYYNDGRWGVYPGPRFYRSWDDDDWEDRREKWEEEMEDRREEWEERREEWRERWEDRRDDWDDD